jgi:hypothetical protein
MSIGSRVSTSLTIAADASESGILDTKGKTVAGVILPAAWTTADLSFLVCNSYSGTYVPLYDSAGTEVKVPSASISTSESRAFDLDSNAFMPWRYVKVRSGVNGTAVNQAAARTVVVTTVTV